MSGDAEAIHEIREKMVGIEHRLNANEEILRELKEVVKMQHKTIIEIVKMQEKQQAFDDGLLQLRSDFDTRNKEIEPVLNEFRTSNAKTKGIVIASLFFMSMLQGTLLYIWNDTNKNVNSRFERIERVAFKENRETK